VLAPKESPELALGYMPFDLGQIKNSLLQDEQPGIRYNVLILVKEFFPRFISMFSDHL
jgi:hypothetical protein